MKKFIFAAIMLLALGVNNSNIYAQSIVRSGNTFKSSNNRSTNTKKDTLVTKYTFEDSKGIQYPIIINKKSGSCYVWKTSKDGKKYPQYMKSEVSSSICKELGIEYKSKKK